MPPEIDARTLSVAATLSPMLGLDDVARAVRIASRASCVTKRRRSYFAAARLVIDAKISQRTPVLLALPAFHESITFTRLLAERNRIMCECAVGIADERIPLGDERDLFRAVRTRRYDVVVAFPELRPEFDAELEAVPILTWRQRFSPLEAIVSHRDYAHVFIGRLTGDEFVLERFHAATDGFDSTYAAWTTTYVDALVSSLRAFPGSYASWHALAHRTEAAGARERAMNLRFAQAIAKESQRFLNDADRALGGRLEEILR